MGTVEDVEKLLDKFDDLDSSLNVCVGVLVKSRM